MTNVDIFGHNPKANIWAYRRDDNQVITTGSWQTIDFTHHWEPIGFETYNIVHEAPNEDEFRFNEDGWYEISFQISFVPSAAGNSREARVTATGSGSVWSDTQKPIGTPTSYQYLNGHSLLPLTTSSILSVYVWQDSGGNLNIIKGEEETWLKIIRVR